MVVVEEELGCAPEVDYTILDCLSDFGNRFVANRFEEDELAHFFHDDKDVLEAMGVFVVDEVLRFVFGVLSVEFAKTLDGGAAG